MEQGKQVRVEIVQTERMTTRELALRAALFACEAYLTVIGPLYASVDHARRNGQLGLSEQAEEMIRRIRQLEAFQRGADLELSKLVQLERPKNQASLIEVTE